MTASSMVIFRSLISELMSLILLMNSAKFLQSRWWMECNFQSVFYFDAQFCNVYRDCRWSHSSFGVHLASVFSDRNSFWTVSVSGPAIETTEKDTEKGHQHGLGRRTRPDPNGLIPLSATCRLRGTAGEGDGWKPMSDGTNRPKGPGAIWTNQIARGYPIRES